MSREKRELEYPVQLESQFIMRVPPEPANVLSELIKSGENFKNRLKLDIHNDMRHGELRLDHWLLHTKIIDLPTIVESWKTIDRKSLYKTADICQLMICKEEFEETTDDDAPSKNKRKDPLKVDKKYLWPHGITPPAKNIRRRRFRKTLRKKCAESPEIEKEVKRLLRADNEAVSFTWEVVTEENEQNKSECIDSFSPKGKAKKDTNKNRNVTNQTSNYEDIFGGALSDSDVDDESVPVDLKNCKSSLYKKSLCDVDTPRGSDKSLKRLDLVRESTNDMFESKNEKTNINKSNLGLINKVNVWYELDNISQHPSTSSSVADINVLQRCVTELEELKLRKQRTQIEISRLENMTLRQRFEDILKTLNKEIIKKEVEYQKLKSHAK